MPPRFAYWTIILAGKPTAFRASLRDELLPTFKQLQNRHPDVVMKWFARGRLWESPEEAQAAQHRGGRESRPAGWRPGGEHRDPRERFKVPRDEKRRRFAERAHRDRRDADTPGAEDGRQRPPRQGPDRSRRPDQRTKWAEARSPSRLPRGDRPPPRDDRPARPDRPADGRKPFRRDESRRPAGHPDREPPRDRPMGRPGQKPAAPWQDRPKSGGFKPRGFKPAGFKPGFKPGGGKPGGGKFGGAKSAVSKPGGARPGGYRAPARRPGGGKPPGGRGRGGGGGSR